MKQLPSLFSPAFSIVAMAFLPVGAARAEGDLPLPSVRGTEVAGPRELQRPASVSKSALQEDPSSVPAPLPLPPEPSPFPSFPPGLRDPEPPEIDLRKRANTSFVPEGPNPTEDAAVLLRDRARYRDLKARALARPEVRSSLEAVQKARSDAALREALRQHYTKFFSAVRGMEKVDRSLEALIAVREREAMASLVEKLPRPAGVR
jgi:hypothetical protein